MRSPLLISIPILLACTLHLRGKDGNASPEQQLLSAIFTGNIEQMEEKLQQVDINAPLDELGNTALHIAAQHGISDMTSALLKRRGINVNAENRNGMTPLHLAASEGHQKVARELLQDTDIEVNIKNNLGGTPLHLAAFKEHPDIAQALIGDENIDVNAKDKLERTPLFLASLHGRSDIALALLTHGADPFIKNQGGKIPLDIAIMKNHTTTAAILSLYMLYYELAYMQTQLAS